MCIFCKIVNQEIPSYKLYEDETLIAILDISQATIGHSLVICKDHYENIMELSEEVASRVLPIVTKLTKSLSKALNTNDFNIINNCGPLSGQTINHFHIHIIPRYPNDNIDFIYPKNELSKEEFINLTNKIKANI